METTPQDPGVDAVAAAAIAEVADPGEAPDTVIDTGAGTRLIGTDRRVIVAGPDDASGHHVAEWSYEELAGIEVVAGAAGGRLLVHTERCRGAVVLSLDAGHVARALPDVGVLAWRIRAAHAS